MSDAVRWAVAETAVGRLLVATRAVRLVFVGFGGEDDLVRLAAFARDELGGVRPEPDASGDGTLGEAVRQLVAYGSGARTDFDLELELAGSSFEQRVWAELQRIPYGETRTYGEVAARLGAPDAVRAVGGANGRNPVPVVVPCHRVVASDGLGGFSGGLENKVALLDHERAHAGRGQGVLFS